MSDPIGIGLIAVGALVLGSQVLASIYEHREAKRERSR